MSQSEKYKGKLPCNVDFLSNLQLCCNKIDEIGLTMRREEQVYQAEQKKYIGNAVEVNMSKVLCESLCTALISKAIAI